jgi:hypothetical protein
MQIAPSNGRPSDVWLSAHGRTRCRQRGTSDALLSIVHDWFDTEVPVGGGSVAVSVSARAAAEMRAEGISAGLVDMARRRALVLSGGRTVTVIAGRQRRGQRYWRQRR